MPKQGICSVESRNECAPIITANVHSDELYDVGLIENDIYVRWYVTDIHGFDLLKGYDPYKSPSGKTLIPYIRNPLFSCYIILLNKSAKKEEYLVHRYNEYICTDNVIDKYNMTENVNIDNELKMIAPDWYANFCSLSHFT